jgi:hypothetical protein
MRKPLLVGLGALFVLVGLVWTLQGLGYLKGSPMTGVTFWAIAGPVLGLVGAGMVALGLRGSRPAP